MTNQRLNDNSLLWDRLRTSREHKGLTQAQMAEIVGVTRGTLSLWESKNAATRTRPMVEHIERYSEVCGVPIAYLVDSSADGTDLKEALRLASATTQRDPSATRRWTNAVENAVTERHAHFEHFFNVKVEAAGLTRVAPYMRGSVLALFEGNPLDWPEFAANCLPDLLLLERMRGDTLKLHVFLKVNPDKINTMQALGITFHSCATAEEAAKILVDIGN